MAIQNINYRDILGQNFARQQLGDRLAADEANREAMAKLQRDIGGRLAEQRRMAADRAEAEVRSRGAVDLGGAIGGGIGGIGGSLMNVLGEEYDRRKENDIPLGDYLKDQAEKYEGDPLGLLMSLWD